MCLTFYLEIQQYHKANLINNTYQDVHNTQFRRFNSRSSLKKLQVNQKTCCQKLMQLFKYHVIQQYYGKYGPNCVIYFGFFVKLILFCFVFCIFVGMVFIALDSSQYCTKIQTCLSNKFSYRISLFNLINQVQYMFPQTIVWLIVSVIICLFMLHLRTYTTKTYKRVNNRNITQADYSIIIRRIPQTATKSDILQLIQTQIKHQILATFPECQSKINQVLKVEEVIMLLKMDETNRSYEQLLEKFKNDIKNNKQRQPQISQIVQPSQFSGTAIVIFNSIQANDYIHRIKNIKFYDKFISHLFPSIYPRSQFTISGKNISINRAPEPTDILWINFGYSLCSIIKRKIVFNLMVLLIIGLSAVVSYFLTMVSLNANSIVITGLTVSAIFLFNWGLEFLLKFAAKQQKTDTVTDLTSIRFNQIVFHQNINLGFFYLILPFIIKLPSIFDGLIAADLPTIMVITLLFFVLITINFNFIIDYFQIKSKIIKYLIQNNYLLKTQKEAIKLTKGPQIFYEQKYSDLVQLFWFGFVFSIISPISIVISTLGLVLYYIYQRILFANIYSIPPYTRIRVSITFISSLQYVILHIGVANFLVHLILAKLQQKEMDNRIFIVSLMNIALGVFFILMPWDELLQKLDYNIDSNEDQKSYRQIYSNFKTTYNQLNPAVTLKKIELTDKLCMKYATYFPQNVNQNNNPQVIGSQRKIY